MLIGSDCNGHIDIYSNLLSDWQIGADKEQPYGGNRYDIVYYIFWGASFIVY